MSALIIVLLLIPFIAFIVGVCLIISGVMKKKEAGAVNVSRVVAGAIVVFLSIVISFFSILITVLKLAVYDPMTSDEVKELTSNVEKVLEENDPEEFADLFAERSIRGDVLVPEDAKDFYEFIDGDFEDVELKVNNYHSADGISSIGFHNSKLTTTSGKTYNVTIYYTYKHNNDDYIGIHYIKVKGNSGKTFEVGTIPYDED